MNVEEFIKQENLKPFTKPWKSALPSLVESVRKEYKPSPEEEGEIKVFADEERGLWVALLRSRGLFLFVPPKNPDPRAISQVNFFRGRIAGDFSSDEWDWKKVER